MNLIDLTKTLFKNIGERSILFEWAKKFFKILKRKTCLWLKSDILENEFRSHNYFQLVPIVLIYLHYIISIKITLNITFILSL